MGMNYIAYILVAALAGVVIIYVMSKRKGASVKASSAAMDESFSFVIFSVDGKEEDGIVEAHGMVGNEPIFVGDVFRMVDRDDQVIAPRVVVERINVGFVQTKYADEAKPSEDVVLSLRMPVEPYGKELFLKK